MRLVGLSVMVYYFQSLTSFKEETMLRSSVKWIGLLIVMSLLLSTAGVVWAQDPTAAGPDMMTGLFEKFDAAKCYQPVAADTPMIKAPQTKEPPYRIAISNSYIGNDWRTEMIQMARAYANLPEIKPLVSELYVVSSGNDANAQIAIVDLMIAAGYDAIILNTASEDALNPVVKRAHDAGILVISFDNVSSSPYAIRINEDQFAFGKTMADWLVKQLNGTGKVFMITGVPGTTVDNGRNAGAHSVFDATPGIEVLGEQPGMWADGPAQTVMSTALAAFPEIDGIWCQGGTTGVIRAFMDAGRDFVPVAGEAENGFRKLAAEHNIPIISVGQTPAMVAVSIKLAIDMLKDGIEVPQEINVPLPIVTSDTMVEGVDYAPDVKDNFFMAFQLPECGVLFTADQILAQDAY
jgi:ribose transport system substrate-binding protein